MNRTFVISVVVMFLVSVALGFTVHGFLLGDEYARLTPTVYRVPEDSRHYFGYMMAGNFLFATGFTWIYRQGRASKPWLAQGVRYGIAIAVLSTIPTFLTYYAVQPVPAALVVKQVIFGALAMVLMGIIVAVLNRDPVPVRT